LKTIKPSAEILTEIAGLSILKNIELYGRVCYKSEEKITNDSYINFVRKIIKNGHESVLEHQSVSVRFICDRGVSHELVRHRMMSISQESTRYCNYTNNHWGNEIVVIRPFFWQDDSEKYCIWLEAMKATEIAYNKLINAGATPQEARSVLPNSLKTEVIMTCNLREWRHFFKLRTSKAAHLQMRELIIPLLAEFKIKIPFIFDDILEE
jgi:thymidylate synthase (FAD)